MKRFAQSLYLDEQQVSTRQCAHEEGMALVVDDLTEDQARRLGRAFESNVQDVEILIHQRINFPVQAIWPFLCRRAILVAKEFFMLSLNETIRVSAFAFQTPHIPISTNT